MLQIVGYCRLLKLPVLFRGESNLVSTSQYLFKTIFIRFFLKQCSALLSIGTDNEEYYLHHGVPKKKIFSVPYAVDNKHFQKKPLQPNVITHKKTEGKTIILYASKFIDRKHPILLIEAFNGLPNDLQRQAELWFIGNGKLKDNMQKKIRQYQLTESVKMLGFKNQSELPWYFSQSDVFVLPSEKEPFGLIINEVMNQAKAIITTNEVGAAHDLVDSDNGWVIEAGSKKALIQALTQALTSPNQLKEKGERSLQKISSWGYQEDIDGIRKALNFVRKNIDHNDNT